MLRGRASTGSPLDARDADVPLSATGQEQADALGTWLAGRRTAIDGFWVSPYVRARQTLAIALGEDDPHAPVIVDERLRDRELGILDLLTSHGVARLQPAEMERRRHLGKFYHRPPGGESWADVALRLRSFLRDASEMEGDSAMVVAHDAVVMLLLYLMLPMDEAQLLEFASTNTVLNASVTHVVRAGRRWELRRIRLGRSPPPRGRRDHRPPRAPRCRARVARSIGGCSASGACPTPASRRSPVAG